MNDWYEQRHKTFYDLFIAINTANTNALPWSLYTDSTTGWDLPMDNAMRFTLWEIQQLPEVAA